MDLLDRYLQAAPTSLPKAQQNDRQFASSRPVRRIIPAVLAFGPIAAVLAMLGDSNLILYALGEAFIFTGTVLRAFAWMHINFFVV
jgi:hypothetical protein